jgi:hypothetical protein
VVLISAGAYVAERSAGDGARFLALILLFLSAMLGAVLADGAAGEPARPRVAQDAQHVILLRRDAGGPEHHGQLLLEGAGDVLEQQVDLALGRLVGVEEPHAPRAVPQSSRHE